MTPRCRFRQFCVTALLSVCVALAALRADASVSVLLEEPYGGFSHLSPSGHTAVYLDRICADTPLHLRLCQPGEFGVVISRYDGVGDHDWIAVPLIGYLYAVDSPQEISAYVTGADVERMRDAYRRRWLTAVAPTLPDGRAPEATGTSSRAHLSIAAFTDLK